MSIYLLCGTQTGWLPVHLLVRHLPVKGLIGLANTAENRKNNEYQCYEDFCQKAGIDYIPLHSYGMKSDADKAAVLALDIDLVLVASWQRLVPDWFIAHCRTGVVGSHGSPLGISRGRGRSPQNWALLSGCKDFTLSIFWIDAGIDSGRVIDAQRFAYTATDDIFTSYAKSGTAMANMMIENHQNGRLAAKAGDAQEEADCQYLPRRTAEDGMVDWHRPADALYDFVRALTKPYPGAYTVLNGKQLHIWQAKPLQESWPGSPAAGEVLLVFPTGELLVQCGQGQLLLTEVSPEEGSPAAVAGEVFTSADYAAQLQAIVERHTHAYPGLPVSQLITDQLK